MGEAQALALALELTVRHAAVVPVIKPRPATLFGQGKVEEIAALCTALKPELVIVNGTLGPVQQRNLEKAWKVKVIDRTGLILEIFAGRARTREGRLQVELAQLEYQKSRLVRTWTHLERQRGGRGFLAGPGETQLEADRRMIDDKIVRLRKDLDAVVRTRGLHRQARKRVPFPVVALVGYTNAGKSTLFNALTKADVRAEDLLFATLDPAMRGVVLKGGRKVILSDTVGFISDLPTQLVAAFRATLEEVREADVLLHVRDIASLETQAQRADVLSVLDELGIGAERQAAVIEVWNKVDLLPQDERAKVLAEAARKRSDGAQAVAVSAVTGDGLDRLQAAIAARLEEDLTLLQIDIAPEDGGGLSWAYRNGTVRARDELSGGGVRLQVAVDDKGVGRFRRRFGENVRPA